MIGQTLGHYRIVEKIGAGGMGEVYRAHDEHLGRDVAIKVLPAGALADEFSRKRFRKEAEALSKLNHPNIATIHDFDTQDGVDFLAMEIVAGMTVAEKLATGALPEKQVVQLGIQLAEGLAAAHAEGVVHRDLKPANLRITPDGRLKILDFGLAKLLHPASGMTTAESLDTTRALAGTLPYMAPEQLRGEPADVRSDIYAAGAVLYEMATGKRPFREEMATALVDHILHMPPPPPGRLKHDLSSRLEELILKCLEKEPENRYQSAQELLVDLRRPAAPTTAAAPPPPTPARITWRRSGLAIGAGLVLLMAALVGFNMGGWRERLRGQAAPTRIESLAVLPLENLSRDPEQEYFADGITEALITDLAQISALRVISRTSVMQYKGARKPLPKIARELNVEAVVEGTVQRFGDRVRITAQLIQASTDKHLWAESYERDLRDVLSLESDVARAIANEIKIKLTPQEQVRLANARPVNPKAHEAYLKGRYYTSKLTEDMVRKGVEQYLRAIEIDPNDAQAYAGLSEAYYMLSNMRVSPHEAMPKARAAALKALELDDTLAEAHTSLGIVKEAYDWDWSGAEREFKRAIELTPGLASAHLWYAPFLSYMGRHDEAIAESKRALELDPLSVAANDYLSEALYFASQYDLTIERARKTIELEPNYFPAHWHLAWAYAQKRMYKEAIAEFQKTISLGGGPLAQAALGSAYAASGNRDEARKMLEQLKALSQRSFIPGYEIAVVYAQLGEKDLAFTWLQKAYEQRAEGLVSLKVDPLLDPLRSDPRFAELLRRVGLPP